MEGHMKEIASIWEKSSYSAPSQLLVPCGDDYLVIIEAVGKIYRCFNRNGQVVAISSVPNGFASNGIGSQTPVLMESVIPRDIDIFVKEKIFPVIFRILIKNQEP